MARPPSDVEDLLRASVDWSWETDADLRLLALSSGFAASLGRPGRMAIGQHLTEIASPHSTPTANESGSQANSLASKLAARSPFRHIPVVCRAVDGRPQEFLLSGLPYYDPQSGAFAGFRGTAVRFPALQSDYSDTNFRLVRLLELALSRKDELEAAWKASELSKDSGRFGEIAHELRTPLNAILGFAEIIRDQRFGRNQSRYREYAGLIFDSGQHLADLIQDLLRASGSDPVPPAQCEGSADPVEVAAFVLLVLEGEAQRKNIGLVNELSPDLPVVSASRRALRQILINLINNAIKYTPEGGRITIGGNLGKDGIVEITVADTGPGIRPEDQERIFLPRVRAGNADVRPEGKGLGLAIARDLARNLGGDITLSSRYGKGSRFTIRLPFQPHPVTGREPSGSSDPGAVLSDPGASSS